MKKRKKRATRTVPALLAAVLLLAADVTAQQPESAEARLRTAMDTADVDGDLKAAISQYQTIVRTFATDREVVASALLRMGQAYDKLGAPEARTAYERVSLDYADQGEAAAEARSRLAALEGESEQRSAALHTEVVWAGARGVSPQGDVSPDGSLVTYVDWLDGGNLAIRNLATGESRRLVHTADNGSGENGGHYALNSRISPDGEQVLYSWARTSPMGETVELRLLPLLGDQMEPRTVWSPADGRNASIQDWFPSGDRVVAVVSTSGTSSIVTVSTIDGQVQQVRSIDWTRRSQVRVSPDGRYLAYSRSTSREVTEKDIFLVAVDGSSESVVVQHSANDELVAWSPDGTHLLFNSDRSSQPGLWAQRVQDGEPAGEPQLLIANLDVGSGMGVTRDGTLHYPVRVTRRRMKIAELDLTTGRFLRQPENVTDRFVGGNNRGVFSPDGETLAYISDRQGWRQKAIVIRSLKTGEELDVSHELSSVFRLSWRPDGDRLIVAGRDAQGRYGPFDVNVATGQTRPLTDIADMSSATLTPDGTQILHRNGHASDRLYSYRVADGSVQALPGVFKGPFSLSPDGQWIATIFRGEAEIAGGPWAGGTEIRLQPAAGGDGDLLLATDESRPFGRWTTWTPDGTALLVLKHEARAGEYMWRLWVVPVDGSDPVATELVHEPANAGSGALDIHPDGARIVYAEGGYFNQFWAVHNLTLDQTDSSSSQ